MNIMSVGIIGTVHYALDNVVTNKDLEKIMDTTDFCFVSRRGIEELSISTDYVDSSVMVFEAAIKALADADLTCVVFYLILFATVTLDPPFPTVSCMLEVKLFVTTAA